MGTGVFVFKTVDGVRKLLVGKRGPGCSRGVGAWALPGGMVEDNESPAKCAEREVKEETNLDVVAEARDEFQDCVMGISYHGPRADHYTLWVVAQVVGDGEPEVVEPLKCSEWRWVTPEEFYKLAPQVGEQVYWSPHRVWKSVLERLGFQNV